jgi:hypothetical protein
VIPQFFINTLSEEEKGLLHLIAMEALAPLGYEPSFDIIKCLKKDHVFKFLENYKSKILTESVVIVEELQKKIAQEI